MRVRRDDLCLHRARGAEELGKTIELARNLLPTDALRNPVKSLMDVCG